MHEVLVNRLGGLSLPRKSVVRLTDRPDMTLDFTVDVKQQFNLFQPYIVAHCSFVSVAMETIMQKMEKENLLPKKPYAL